MIRYLIYFITLYLVLPFNALIDIIAIIVFFTITEEDERFALVFAFIAGILIDLYYPLRLGINTIIFITVTGTLIYVKKYLIRNPLTTFATFVVFYLIKTALTNLIISAPISPAPVFTTILAFFPVMLILSKIAFGLWMRKQ
jgi:cell shape-determining protein MreD